MSVSRRTMAAMTPMPEPGCMAAHVYLDIVGVPQRGSVTPRERTLCGEPEDRR